MTFENKLCQVQVQLVENGMDGWLLFDYHRSNPLAHAFLEIPPDKMATRRFFYWIPKDGDPIKIVSSVEPFTLDHLPGQKWTYRGWQDLQRLLFSIASNNRTIAMEYSPCNALPSLSKVDAGMIELMRKGGAVIASSGNILQSYTSVWTEEQLKSHMKAACALDEIVERAWVFIEQSLQFNAPIDEYKVQQFMLESMQKKGCVTADPPICAAGVHSADPHYQPSLAHASPIRPGDFILLDLWCKQNVPHAVYADITRAGVASAKPALVHEQIFEIVKCARDAATAMIKGHHESRRPLQGWQADQACRTYIQEAGFGDYFIHRTGHNIGEDVHGAGANLDNLETHDDRELLLGTGFSVEPGIYLPGEFGVRLEYDIYLDPHGPLRITGGVQTELRTLRIT